MDSRIIVALIAAVATIAAALIAALVKRSGSGGKPSTSTGFSNISAGRDAVVAGGDAFVVQQVREDRFISKDGGRLITQVSKEVITDEDLRQRWNSFDAKFLARCVKDTPRGMVFDSDAFQEFNTPEYDQMFSLGVQVYSQCCERLTDRQSADYAAFNRIAQLYLSARMAVRSAA